MDDAKLAARKGKSNGRVIDSSQRRCRLMALARQHHVHLGVATHNKESTRSQGASSVLAMTGTREGTKLTTERLGGPGNGCMQRQSGESTSDSYIFSLQHFHSDGTSLFSTMYTVRVR